MQKIIAVNPELKGHDARVVFSRDWWPNAFSMGDGTIAINAGLFVYLSNEAELVFVVCHELAHYYLDHTNKAIKKYVETVNSEQFQSELKRLSKTQYGVNRQLAELTRNFAFNSRRHSRDNEAAADRMAFAFMKRTGYDCNAITSCLELLDKIDEAKIYEPADIQHLFNFPAYPFKKKWIQEETSIFSQMSDSDSHTDKKEKDSLKTHPDCSKRIALLKDSILALPINGEKFLVNETLFQQLRKDFFVEMSEQCYRDNNLSRNLYYSLLLLQAKEQVPLAAYSIIRTLNTIHDSQVKHQLGSKIDKEAKGYPADYNHLLRMLERLRLDEIAALSRHFAIQYKDVLSSYREYEQEIKRIPKQ